jgi:NAD(P)H-hydrate epimerase
MKAIESKAMEEYGFTESLIMENVGVRASEFLEEVYLNNQNYGEIIVLVGHGNNGADALAIARNLANKNHSVRAFILFPDGEGTVELKNQAIMAKAFGVKLTEVRKANDLNEYFNQTQANHFIIDGILGTGFKQPLSNYLFDIVNIINNYSSVCISIDIPSGISGETGAISSTAIKADVTLAIGLPKTGHYIAAGAAHSGDVLPLDVGFPLEILTEGNKSLLSIETVLPYYDLRSRNEFAHKNNFGHTLVIGGSQGLTGALLLASNASLASGTGLVTAATWDSNYGELASRVSPEIMTGLIPTDEREIKSALRNLDRFNSIVIGPGLGISPESRETVLEVLNYFAGPVVVDADALKVLSLEDAEVFHRRKGPTILTPHIGEFAKFIGADVSEVQENPLNYIKELVDRLNCCVVLKDACTFLGFPNGERYISYYPNSGMATGGSGDVLAGLLGGVMAQQPIDNKVSGMFLDKTDLYNSLCLAVMTHSLAGKHAALEKGARSMNAGNIVEHISSAFLELDDLKNGGSIG